MLRQTGRREDGRTARDAPRPRWSERGTERPRSPAERSARLPPPRAGSARPAAAPSLAGGAAAAALIGPLPGGAGGGAGERGARQQLERGRPPQHGPARPCPARSTRARPGPPAGSAARQGLTGSVPRSSAGPDQPPGATVGVMAREREGEREGGMCKSSFPHSHKERALAMPQVESHSLARKRSPVLNKQTRSGAGSRPVCLPGSI